MTIDTLIIGGTVVLPYRGPQDLDIAVSEGKVVGLLQRGLDPPAKHRVQADGLHILPGGVDPHVHFGIAMPKESDYYTESCAAASGGVTTVINYDRGRECYSRTFPDWLVMARANFVMDFGFHLGILTEAHLAELDRYVREFGVTSFKFYMNYRGSERAIFGSDTALDDGFLYRILRKISGMKPDIRLCVHCENMEINRALEPELQALGEGSLSLWELIRPGFGEAETVNRSLYLAKATGASVYIVHVSAKESLEQLARWDLETLNCFAETCPHYLCATVDTVSDLAKVNPPVRQSTDAEALWGAIGQGIVTTVGSDHVPRTLEMKQGQGGFRGMKSGFPGVNTTLPLLITEGVQKRGLSLGLIARIFSTNAARIFGLYPTKGTIMPGSDADLVFVDLVTEQTVSGDQLLGACDWSVYEGRRLVGWPMRTMVRGEVVYDEGQILKSRGFGQYLSRAK